MKTALVTGGAGFIGHHLCNELARRGYRVTAVDKVDTNAMYLTKNINFIVCDIRKIAFHRVYQYVYHLATLNNEVFHNDEMISTNVWGTYHIAKSFTSSRAVFASSYKALDTNDIYGTSLKCAEHYMNMHKNSVCIRLPEIFGEESYDNDVYNYFDIIKNKKKIKIVDNKLIDYVYVKDIVAELIKIGESRIKGITETGYGYPLKQSDLYKIINSICKTGKQLEIDPVRKGKIIRVKSKYKINEPQYGFAEGLRRTMRWYMEKKQQWDTAKEEGSKMELIK